MKKIMFNDKYCLTQAVLDGTKTMTRRSVPQSLLDEYDTWYEDFIYKPIGEENYLSLEEYVLKCTTYKVGEVVAIAQPYKDIIECLPMYSDAIINVDGSINREYKAGWTNKMFVKGEMMLHHIKITDVKVESLQDISDEDILREGIRYYHSSDKRWSNDSGYGYHIPKNGLHLFDTPYKAFANLFKRISGKGTWESNPWVVAYSFELVD